MLGRGLLAGTLGGIVYGALVGIGFAFTENVVYLTFAVLQGGSAGLWRGASTSAPSSAAWNHAAFTATSGAALGWALGPGRPRGRWLVAAIGLALATLQHVVWNAVAASAIQGVLCGPELAGGPCRPIPTDTSLFVSVPALTAIFIGAGVHDARRHCAAPAGRAGRSRFEDSTATRSHVMYLPFPPLPTIPSVLRSVYACHST